jgi:geranylgeranyl diphosphate synthase type II
MLGSAGEALSPVVRRHWADTHAFHASPGPSRLGDRGVAEYLDECRELVLDEIRQFLPESPRYRAILYDLMLEYPMRHAKALRPALCIAICRALGGPLEGVSKSAAVLEFYHNAFLIHDDIEDGSEKRRDGPTLHRSYGVPIAVNVGDAMLALALEPLLDNVRLLDLGKALRIMQLVARMARESAEGQALELSLVRERNWTLVDRDYLRLVHKKTTWYTFTTPLLIGAMVAGADEQLLAALRRYATALGLAFQIQDDALNLTADEGAYGKEILGDLWEGKHTLVLTHTMRSATPREAARARRILSKERAPRERPATKVAQTVARLAERGEIGESARIELLKACAETHDRRYRTLEDVEFLFSLVKKYDSIAYARGVARRRALRAEHSLERLSRRLSPSVHLDFLRGVTNYVIERER